MGYIKQSNVQKSDEVVPCQKCELLKPTNLTEQPKTGYIKPLPTDENVDKVIEEEVKDVFDDIKTDDFGKQFTKTMRQHTWGKYLYILEKKQLQPIEVAILWFYHINGIDKFILPNDLYTYEHVKKIEQQIEHCLIEHHIFPLNEELAEYKAAEIRYQEELAAIREKKRQEIIKSPRFCEECKMMVIYCGCNKD